jgi:hypothetical protein
VKRNEFLRLLSQAKIIASGESDGQRGGAHVPWSARIKTVNPERVNRPFEDFMNRTTWPGVIAATPFHDPRFVRIQSVDFQFLRRTETLFPTRRSF